VVLKVSVIGRDQKATHGSVVEAETGHRRKKQQRRGGDRQLLERQPAVLTGLGRG